MIPVLGIPVINRPDLLRRCIASIDHPTDRLLVIDNSGMGELGDAAALMREDALIVDPPSNLGVAASWNFTIRTSPEAPWWLLANADIAFAPGELAELATFMDAQTGPAVGLLVEFGAFALNAECVEAVGFFDENFVPIYCEDTDYRRRCHLAGVPLTSLPSRTTHVGSVSYQGRHAPDNARTYPQNVAYYRAKWGGWIGEERYASPFDEGGSVADWTLDLARLRSLSWSLDAHLR